MKTSLLILSFLILSFTSTFGQAAQDSITLKKDFWGYKFYQGDKRVQIGDLVNIMRTNEEAYKSIKSAQSNYTMASIIGFAGGFMVGWPIGTAIAGGDPSWGLAGIGAGFLVATIPLTNSFVKKSKFALDAYNGGSTSSSVWDRSEMSLSLSGSGLGLSLRF
ncbi:hypothetical protein SAMN04489724_3311 [Algoriphagus locisalis]|uniref:Uncharacterized protein n=1 Tax=Algoriphagus locisalis TaxID=305507 RepID=A0A1I7CQF6_9BACT|nr:hypothetical protein [Algoriphagus locisalis]SFU01618.1 hypothetical protein SAMN04489724_3311 [Algoriphagus locisalis]